MLFVIIMEVLNALITEADHHGVFSPIPEKIKDRAAIYADDLVIFLSPDVQDFTNIRRILDLFARASDLITNVDKCVVTPIHCHQEQVDAVREVFPCKLQEFPITYLGAPLSISRICRGDEQRLVDAVAARIPTWKGDLLTNVGRKTLTQTTLSAIPVHISICCCLSAWAISEIDCRRRAFLWTGSDAVSGGKCKIAWPIVCAPKEHGRLGIPDLRIQGFALRLRWEWLRRTRPNTAWASLPSTSERKVSAMFQQSVTVEVGDGTSARFWTDSWLLRGPISIFALNLFRVVGSRRRGRSVKDALAGRQWVQDITGARTAPVMYEYHELWGLLENTQLTPSTPDRFVWRWTADG
jgi:hypothetical protein